jgi:hypothetical protein
MRRRQKARLLRRLALGPLAALSPRAVGGAVTGSRRPALLSADPTQAPVGAGRAIRPAPLAAGIARSARFVSTPAAA